MPVVLIQADPFNHRNEKFVFGCLAVYGLKKAIWYEWLSSIIFNEIIASKKTLAQATVN